MDIGVQTKGLFEECEDLLTCCTMLKSAGFLKVDYNLDVFLPNFKIYAGQVDTVLNDDISELYPLFEEYGRAIEACGMTVSQMHAPYPVYVPGKPEVTEYMKGSIIPKSIMLARAMKVPLLVVHPFKLQYAGGMQAEWDANIAYFNQLIPFLKENGVKICFENLYESINGRIVEGVCSNPEIAARYVDHLNYLAGEELFGFCLDLGHLQLSRRDPYHFVKYMGKRIKILHLHENDGISDLHGMPFTFGRNGESVELWDALAQALAEVEFDGTLSFETFPCMNSFPGSVQEQVLGVIYSCGTYLRDRMAYYQQMLGSNE